MVLIMFDFSSSLAFRMPLVPLFLLSVSQNRVLVLKVLEENWLYCSFLFWSLISLHFTRLISLDYDVVERDGLVCYEKLVD